MHGAHAHVHELGLKTSYYIQEESVESLSHVVSKLENGSFKEAHHDRLNLGFQKNTVWISVAIKNETSKEAVRELKFLFPNLNHISVYEKKGISFRHLTAYHGHSLAQKSSEAIHLHIPAKASLDLLIQVDSTGAKILNFELFDSNELSHYENRNVLINGLFYGVIFVLFFNSLFIYFFERKSSYLAYALFLISFTLAYFIFQDYHYSFIHVHDESFYDRISLILFVSTFVSFNRFTQLFLNSKASMPKLHKALHMVNVFWLLFAFQVMLYPLVNVSKYFLIFATFNSVFLTMVALKKSTLNSQFKAYPLAWAVSNFFGLSAILLRFDLLPYNQYSQFLPHLAIVSTALIFAIAMGLRIRAYQDEQIEQKHLAKVKAEETRDLLLMQKIQLEEAAKERTRELELAKEEALKANNLKSRFLANMSHELRTPLNSIVGFTNLLKTDLKDEGHKSYLGIIENSSNNLLRIINDILDISRIEANRVSVDLTPYSIEALIKECSEMIKVSALEKGLELEVSHDDSIHDYVLIDGMKVHQVLTNLIANAVKYTREGSIKVKSSLLSQDDETLTCLIEIKDTGPGIPEESLEKIFEAYEKGRDQDKEIESTGLGLSISKKLAELMNMDLWVESEVGVGSIFKFRLNNLKKEYFED